MGKSCDRKLVPDEGPKERVTRGATNELEASAMTMEEREKEEVGNFTVNEVLAIMKIPEERKLEDELEKDVAVRASERTTEGVGDAPDQADQRREAPHGSTRRRSYHKIVVEPSDKEEDEDVRPRVPLTKRPRTYRPTHPRVVSLIEGVLPQVESPQPPPHEQKKGRMPAKGSAKESGPLTLKHNMVLHNENEDEAEAQGGKRQITAVEGEERALGVERGPNYRKISI